MGLLNDPFNFDIFVFNFYTNYLFWLIQYYSFFYEIDWGFIFWEICDGMFGFMPDFCVFVTFMNLILDLLSDDSDDCPGEWDIVGVPLMLLFFSDYLIEFCNGI